MEDYRRAGENARLSDDRRGSMKAFCLALVQALREAQQR